MDNKNYTAEETVKAMKESGYVFNSSDIELAKKNPNAGMQLLEYKKAYTNAPAGADGDNARAIARAGAEFVRASYGGYGTSEDGSRVIASGTMGNQKKPTGAGYALVKGKNNGASGNMLYNQYKASLQDAQRKAMENVYGIVSAATDGNLSSSAITKAAAAGADYSLTLADKALELENQQYQRDEAEKARMLEALTDENEQKEKNIAAVDNMINSYINMGGKVSDIPADVIMSSSYAGKGWYLDRAETAVAEGNVQNGDAPEISTDVAREYAISEGLSEADIAGMLTYEQYIKIYKDDGYGYYVNMYVNEHKPKI